MTFLIVTHVPHVVADGKLFAYGPYVREMNIWLKYVDRVIIVAPLESRVLSDIDSSYQHFNIDFRSIRHFNVTNFTQIFHTLLVLPSIALTIYRAMKKADHIHLRCPGNVGLIGVALQRLFPNKTKTAKYAGNWDPKARQPCSYKLQKRLLQNPAFSKQMTVLVYGLWKNFSSNVKPFFTASYSDKIIQPLLPLTNDQLCIVFAGTLTPGKGVDYAIELIHRLKDQGVNVRLDIFGEGVERNNLIDLISLKQIASAVWLHGNRSIDDLTNAYRNAHFVVLPSASEGWPKAIAEGMFWGAIPLASDVSCIKNMLDGGRRGVILSMDAERDTVQILKIIQDIDLMQNMRRDASVWSRQFTLESFEQEIKKLLQK